ncbi:unnamed protein product [Gongylonema pulchrum]|uniref:Cyclin N-terminal domain-containing protein n=1 Tax=Gongylonema pulchrum TaxID=637853 RepID=A0A183EXA1_9BILA|nr:unnamed protein product [Gongylonema pulchrum]
MDALWPVWLFGATSSSPLVLLPAHEPSLLTTVYDRDVYEHERILEQKYQINEDFLAFQEEISPEMRYIVVEWLSNVATDFGLCTLVAVVIT